ncbi:2'-5' RNA ligase family protein [Actinomadura sp. WAC 06369]|uniref:2'-5' RNA ligase family protein n=1 Tax=Actinomadura sp. WAC 06369 TaxID=2203193 RepID=UPI001F3E29F8|nr:2'-5' RNA ligase family protein [Actinomadura sp. WAC 06369]
MAADRPRPPGAGDAGSGGRATERPVADRPIADTFVGGMAAVPPHPDARTIGVAVPIPEPFGSWLQARRASYGDPLAGAIPTHITLLPPTEVDAAALGVIDRHLRAVARDERPFVIRLRGSGTFRPVSPVVFVAVAEGISGCERLQARVSSGPLERPLAFPYHPHVTIAHHLPDDVMDRAFKDLADFRADFDVWGFALYEHGRDGVWRPQRDYLFGDAAIGREGPDTP